MSNFAPITVESLKDKRWSGVVQTLQDYESDKRRFVQPDYIRVNPKTFAASLSRAQGIKDARRICDVYIKNPETSKRDRVFYRNVRSYLK